MLNKRPLSVAKEVDIAKCVTGHGAEMSVCKNRIFLFVLTQSRSTHSTRVTKQMTVARVTCPEEKDKTKFICCSTAQKHDKATLLNVKLCKLFRYEIKVVAYVSTLHTIFTVLTLNVKIEAKKVRYVNMLDQRFSNSFRRAYLEFRETIVTYLKCSASL